MVQNVIKVYARIKKEEDPKNKVSIYEILKSEDGFEDIVVRTMRSPVYNRVKPVSYQFRFYKIFDQEVNQRKLYDSIARPIVNSVLNGFNGTIFAYGQTGSGKTYAITGSSKDYQNRGFIPRCLQHIFEYINHNPEVYTVHISYLEIYNEVGYDLLNPKRNASFLEELPKIVFLEDQKGEAHLKNISVHPVSTEKEAMRLLFLGDTNRTIAETPMNEYSSRSHCIFTIYLATHSKTSQSVRRSKLHLVDLAGSERIRKSSLTGTTLMEAKNINLSLHYLEQVILALSQSNRPHIPYRNSMLTYLLRDSLSGNCLTAMVATLAFSPRNIDESLSTCKFARRVSMISTNPKINEEFDTHKTINKLEEEVIELREKLSRYQNQNQTQYLPEVDEHMSGDKAKKYKLWIQDYAATPSAELGFLKTIPEMKYCISTLREYMATENAKLKKTIDKLHKDLFDTKKIVQQKDEELDILRELLEPQKSHEAKEQKVRNMPEPTPRQQIEFESQHIEQRQHKFERFITDLDENKAEQKIHDKCVLDKMRQELKEYQRNLDKKFKVAEICARTIQQCKSNIINIKSRLELSKDDNVKRELKEQLLKQQNIYRQTILDLCNIEKETNHLKLGLNQVEMRLNRKLEGETPNKDSGSRVWAPNSELEQNYFVFDYHDDSPKYLNDSPTNSNDTARTHLSNLQEPGSSRRQFDDKFSVLYDSKLQSPYSSPRNAAPSYTTPKFSDFNSIMSPKGQQNEHKNTSMLKEFMTEYSPGESEEKIRGEVDFCDAQQEEMTSEGGDTPRNESYVLPLINENDGKEFIEFMKTIPLTGDKEVDDEIFNFYRSKFNINVE